MRIHVKRKRGIPKKRWLDMMKKRHARWSLSGDAVEELVGSHLLSLVWCPAVMPPILDHGRLGENG